MTAKKAVAAASPDDRFSAAIDELVRLRNEFASEVADGASEELDRLRETLRDKAAEIDELKRENDGLEERLIDQNEHTDALCRVRRAIREGRKDDALWDIERVLGDLDTCWRTRAC